MKQYPNGQITVVIPTWNHAELLRRCLLSLKAQSAPHRVLVVDNGSRDDTASMLADSFPDVGVLTLKRNLGFAAAVNRGLERTRTPFVALLNNDTEADPGWIEVGLTAFARYPNKWFFACRMIDFFDRTRLDSAGDCYTVTGMPTKRGNGQHPDRYNVAERVLGASAGAAFYRREIFDEIGLFDEGYFMYLEDVDFSVRAQLAGYGCFYLPEAIVYHVEAASDPERGSDTTPGSDFYSTNRVFWITRNRWLLMVTHQPFRSLPWLIYGWLRSLLFHLLKAGFAGSFLKGVVAGCIATPAALSKRKRLRARRRLNRGELWKLLRQC